MLCEIIHPNFRIDLTGKKLAVVEENSWFNSRFFVKYSYPFTFDITLELDKQLQMLSQLQRSNRQTAFDVVFLIEGERKDAVFLIESQQGFKGRGKISYGFDELPNWNKKLAELPLESENVAGDFYAFAKAVALQSYPAVNYNFPKVIPPKDAFDLESDRWQFFQGFLNFYRNDDFMTNVFDGGNNLELNRNVMQPMPYLIYLLKVGFQDAGFTLQGDILEDPVLQKAIVVTLSTFYQSTSVESFEFVVNGNDYSSINDEEQASYNVPQVFNEPGRYVISGSCYVRSFRIGTIARAVILYKGELIFEKNNFGSFYNENFNEQFQSVDVVIDVFQEDIGEEIVFQSLQYPFGREIEGGILEDPVVLDVTISKIAGYDSDNFPQSTLNVPSEIKLTECVPDMTFGDLFKAVRSLKNYDLSVGNGVATVNRIVNQMKDMQTVNLTPFESQFPPVEYGQGDAYMLKYQDIDSELFTQKPLRIDRLGTSTQLDEEEEGLTTIVINLVPLPQQFFNEHHTAAMVTDGTSKVQLALFDGISNGNNSTVDPQSFNIDAVYADGYQEWINFRLNAQKVQESFSCTPEFARKLKTYVAAYMHKGRYIPKIITKNIVNKDRVDVVIEAYKI